MPDETLTEQQRIAVETLDADLLVSAGAGTGKTRVLTHRFSHIVETGRAAVDEILTLTFTEKAAREMKQRIVRRFVELGREQERRQVETAYISTIHSFCARVLRENALEAGIDPYFTQLDEPEAAIIQHQVYDDLIRRAHDQGDAATLAVLRDFDYRSLRGVLHSLYRHMRSLGKAPAELAVAPPEDLAPVVAQARDAVHDALALESEGASEALARVLGDVRGSLERINALLDTRRFDWAAWGALDDVARLFKGNVGTKAQKPVLARAKEAILSFAAALLSHAAAGQGEAVRRLLAAFDTAYAAAKDEEGQLDFDDLLVKARDLFGAAEHPTATGLLYRERFKFFLMDEFQDTNRLQMSVVAPIVRPQTRFTVGDAKQSIYRFLYADVDVFLGREREITGSGGAPQPLSENFRSHPHLLSFTNAFFRELWAEDDFPFGPLEPGTEFGARDEPRVEVLLAADAENMPAARAQEAELIARRVAEITGHGGGDATMLTEQGRECRARFGDILILFRSTADIQLCEDALHERGIPYYTLRGRGFFRTQEVHDLRNLLAVLENPLDDVAMAGVLRSPLVGVSDEALYWLGAPAAYAERDEDELPRQSAGRIAAGLARVEGMRNLSDQDAERLHGFSALLAELRQAAAESRVADLLDEAIRCTAYDLKALCQRNGRRRYANIEKLRQIALSFQSKARFTLRDFLDYLETLEVVAERETEAPTEAEEADVVRLMTIHAAKGLEAPIVIIADLSRQQRSDSDPAILSGAGDIAVKVRNPLTDALVEPPDYTRLRDAARAADIGETKRLFYVACTRAKEHLLLSAGVVGARAASGTQKPYNDLGTWAQWVGKFFGLTEAPAAEGELFSGDGFTATLRSDVADPAGMKERPSGSLLKRFRARIEAGQPLDLTAISADRDAAALSAEAQAVAERVAVGVAPQPACPSATVTGAIRYHLCPRLYELTIVDRVPEPDGPRGDGDDPRVAAEDYQDPRNRGTRLHDLLRGIDFHGSFDDELERLTRDWPEDERADGVEVLTRFRGIELWQQLAQADARRELLREIPFSVRFDDGILRGQADVLMRHRDEWTIVDYKSGARHDEEHGRQVQLYALACRTLLGATPARGIIYYLDLGETETVSIDDAALQQAAAALVQAMRGIAAADFERRQGAACAACAFAPACQDA
ncbi:MAG: UvrD-helicase domain-containing protein [Armatimonadota bacterium]|nr:MAG: UvrD-helicase domain-containing protein [Armatimonadota bacterium]